MAIRTSKRHETVGYESVDWLPRTKVRGKTGDFLVVVLSSAVFIMLGLAAMIVRFGPAEPSNSANLSANLASPRAASGSPQSSGDAQKATSKAAPVAQKQVEIVRSQNEGVRNEGVRNIASVGSNPPVPSLPASPMPVPMPAPMPMPMPMPVPVPMPVPALPADALAPGPVAREPAIVAAAPIATQPIKLVFAPTPPPAAPTVIDDLEAIPEPPVRSAPRKPETAPEMASRPEASRPEASRPEASSAAPERTQIAKAGAPSPEAALRKGGEGATWAAYFDTFPDQRAAAAQINALQGKYGPHLGGKRLTYTRKGESWLMRASGLTQEAADQVCEKVRKAGSPCSVGAK